MTIHTEPIFYATLSLTEAAAWDALDTEAGASLRVRVRGLLRARTVPGTVWAVRGPDGLVLETGTTARAQRRPAGNPDSPGNGPGCLATANHPGCWPHDP